MAITVMVLMLATAALFWLQEAARPQPVRVRRDNPPQALKQPKV